MWNVDPVMVTLGPISIRWYGIFFGSTFLLGYVMLYWQFKRARLTEAWDDLLVLYQLVFFLVIGAGAGAYFGHRIFYNWDRFFTNPLSLMSLRGGLRGLSSHGAAIGILTAAFLFHLQSKMRYVEILDRLSFSVAVAAILVRLGNLMNSEIVGRKTNVAWAFYFQRYDGTLIPRHPSQIYEAFIGLAVLVSLFMVDRKAGGEKRPLGLMSSVFLLIYFPLRFLTEFFKEHHILPAESPLTMGQYLSMPFVVVGVCLLVWSLKNRLPAGKHPVAADDSSIRGYPNSLLTPKDPPRDVYRGLGRPTGHG
jgi:prolipoprotein diacylglyceryl transferase